MSDCLICERVKSAQEGSNPFMVREFKNSFLVLGDHQFFEGYSLLLLKSHVRELHELPSQTQRELFEELMIAGKAVFDAFKPWKMNYSCYGNQVPHVHWHIFPRYESDPDRMSPPWLRSHLFDSRPAREPERGEAIRKVRAQLEPR